MPRHDKKRWWEGKPTPPKIKWYGIAKKMSVGYMTRRGAAISFYYIPVPYNPTHVFEFQQKLSLEEAEALCVILNAGRKDAWINVGV